MLYGYLLYLHSFLDRVRATSGAEGAGGPRWRLWGHRILVDGVAGPMARFLLALGLVVRFQRLTVRDLLVFLDRGAPREGSVTRRRLLGGPGALRRFYGRPGRHWQRFLPVGRTVHRCPLLVAVPLVVDAREYQHVQHQQDAANTHGDGQGSGRAVVMPGSQSLQQLSVVLGIV